MRSLSQERERDRSLAGEHPSDEESDPGEGVSGKQRQASEDSDSGEVVGKPGPALGTWRTKAKTKKDFAPQDPRPGRI